MTRGSHPDDRMHPIPHDDYDSIKGVLYPITAQSTGPAQILEVWIAENRMRAERKASARIMWATVALVGATLVLAAGTFVLAFHGG